MPKNIRVDKIQFGRVLIFIFFIGLVLRLVGIYPGYPPDHPDEPILTVAFSMLKSRTLDPFTFGFYRFQYPGFLPYFYQMIMGGIFVPVTLLVWFMRHPVVLLENLPRSDSFFLTMINGVGGLNYLFWSRFITALLGWLTVPLIFIVGKKLFNSYVGLVAAALVAVNYRHVISSHMSLVDAPTSAVVVFSFFLILRLLEKPRPSRYVAAAVGVGLALATKLYFFSVLPFLFAHATVALRERSLVRIMLSLFSPIFFASLFFIIGTFLIANPFLPVHWQTAWNQQSINGLRYGFGSNSLVWHPLWFLYEIGYGHWPTLLFLAGLVFGCFKRTYRLGSLLTLLLIGPPMWVLVYYSHGGFYARNFTLVVPFAAIFSALAIVEIFYWIATRLRLRIGSWFVLALTIVVSLPQLRNSAILAYELALPWNRDCYKNWAEQHLPSGAKIARTTGVPMVSDNRVSYVPHSNTLGHRTAFSLREMAETNTDFLAINYTESQIYFYSTIFAGISLRGIPKTVLDNSFEGLALKELSRYTTFRCFKPWQSLDSNLAMVKIPTQTSPAVWREIYHTIHPVKVNAKNSVTLPQRTLLTPIIPIDDGKLYRVKASLRTDQELPPEKRDGYIRVDFVPNSRTAISSRLFGSINLQDKEIIEMAPPGTNSLQLSFQNDEGNTDFFIEEVTVSVASSSPSTETKKAVTVPEVDDAVVYPQFIF